VTTRTDYFTQTHGLPSADEDSQIWQERYRIAYTNQLPLFKRFADWYDGMYTIVNQKNYAMWRSKVYLPILGSRVWNLIAKFIALKPGFEVRPRQSGISDIDLGIPQEVDEMANRAQLLLEYDYDNPRLKRTIRQKLEAVLMDAAVTGTGLAKIPWEMSQETHYSHPMKEDGTVDMSQQEASTITKGYNDLIPINIFNVFVAPSSNDLYSAPWLIVKEWKTLDQLKAVNQAKGIEVYKNLNNLGEFRATGDPLAIYKKSRNRLTVQYDPLISDRTVDFIEIYECYENDKIITYANAGTGGGSNWVCIRSVKNPYWHGRYPLVRFVVKQRPFDFWGEGIWETNQILQSAMNDIFNHYLDNWNLSVDGMLMMPENAGVNDYVVEPGGMITYRTDEPKQFKFPEPNPASFNMVMNHLIQALEDNSISGYSIGTPSDATDQTRGTKGGILAIQQAADDFTAFMRANFQEAIKEVGQMWLSNNRQFMMTPEVVTVTKNHKVVPVVINPSDLQADMELRIDESSMIPITDDQIKAQYGQYIQQLMQVQQASIAQHSALGTVPVALDFNAIIEELGEKFGFRNTSKLISQLPQGTSPVQAGQMSEMAAKMAKAQAAQGQGQPQAVAPKLNELINYKDAPPDIRRQIEAQAGLQPSSMEPQSPGAPGISPADLATLQMAHSLHASGKLHPLVVNAIRQHLGMPPMSPANSLANHLPQMSPQPMPAPAGPVPQQVPAQQPQPVLAAP
jgi:hypothetical protein